MLDIATATPTAHPQLTIPGLSKAEGPILDPAPGVLAAANIIGAPPPTPTRATFGAVQLTEGETFMLLEHAGWPEEWRADGVAIANCESHWSPGAVGDGGASLGIFQMWTGWFREGEDPFDPVTNARVALRVRELRGRFGGSGGWTCAAIVGVN